MGGRERPSSRELGQGWAAPGADGTTALWGKEEVADEPARGVLGGKSADPSASFPTTIITTAPSQVRYHGGKPVSAQGTGGLPSG